MRNAIFLALILVLFMPAPAHAYLDAGTIGMVFQVILGGIVGFIVWVKFHWQGVKNFLISQYKRQNQIK
ncbi:catalase [Rhodospirillales bacterium]|nr:catalase [Rhodospirillales bacterium]